MEGGATGDRFEMFEGVQELAQKLRSRSKEEECGIDFGSEAQALKLKRKDLLLDDFRIPKLILLLIQFKLRLLNFESDKFKTDLHYNLLSLLLSLPFPISTS